MALRNVGAGGAGRAVSYKELERIGIDPRKPIDNPEEVLQKLGKGNGSKSPLTPEQQQNLKKFVNNFANKLYPSGGVGKEQGNGVNQKELDRIINHGWEGIPNGEIVYVSTFHKGEPYGKNARNPDKFYRKVDNDTVMDHTGKQIKMNATQKTNMLGTYALQKAVVKPAL